MADRRNPIWYVRAKRPSTHASAPAHVTEEQVRSARARLAKGKADNDAIVAALITNTNPETGAPMTTEERAALTTKGKESLAALQALDVQLKRASAALASNASTKQVAPTTPPVTDVSELVFELEYEDCESKSDKLTLKVNNFDLSNFDNPVWSKGTVLEAQWGYPGNLTPLRECVIQKVTGFQILTVEALDKGIVLNKETKSRSWTHTTRSEVVRQLAKEEGFDFERVHIESTEVVYESISQARLTNAAFLKQLAAKEGFEFYVDFDGFHWHPKRLGQKPIREFVWYTSRTGDLKDLNVENDVTDKPAAVVARGRDPLTKQTFEVKADDKSTKREGTGAVLEAIDPRKASTYDTVVAAGTASTSPTTEPNAAAAKRAVDGQFRQAQITVVKLKGKSVGDPGLVAKSIVRVSGIRSLSGNYYLTDVKHRINASGFENEWVGKRDGRSATPGTKPAPSSAAQNNQPAKPPEDQTLEPIDGRRATTTWTDTKGRSSS